MWSHFAADQRKTKVTEEGQLFFRGKKTIFLRHEEEKKLNAAEIEKKEREEIFPRNLWAIKWIKLGFLLLKKNNKESSLDGWPARICLFFLFSWIRKRKVPKFADGEICRGMDAKLAENEEENIRQQTTNKNKLLSNEDWVCNFYQCKHSPLCDVREWLPNENN